MQCDMSVIYSLPDRALLCKILMEVTLAMLPRLPINVIWCRQKLGGKEAQLATHWPVSIVLPLQLEPG